jgi:hypothetical protein
VSVARPVGGWLPGLWIRYDTGLLQGGPPLEEGAAGVSFGRLVRLSPVKLLRDLPRPAGSEARTDMRLGAHVAAAWPADRSLRGLLVLDAEVSPRHGAPPPADGTRPFPRYTLGAGLWLEVAL